VTSKFFIAAAATLAFSTFSEPQIAHAATTFSSQNSASSSELSNALSGVQRGAAVYLTDSTQVGVVKSAEINNFGQARIFINTKGYPSVVHQGRTLILTASARRVKVSNGSIVIDVERVRLINNLSRDVDSGYNVRATILN
jgi:hypothetical protein